VEKEKPKRLMVDRFWGRAATIAVHSRAVMLVLALSAILSMSFVQLGFWSIGEIADKPVYLMLILGPLIMGALIFGPFLGAVLGLFTGAVLFAHALLFPLDFYEVYFMTPLNTFVLFTIVGALAGWLFKRTLRSSSNTGAHLVQIAVICLAMSFVASLLVQVNTVIWYGGWNSIEAIREYLLCSPQGLVVQALIDAIIMFVLCLVVERVMYILSSTQKWRKLIALFRSWMYTSSVIVFMLASALIFSVATYQEQLEASEEMSDEISYLAIQLNEHMADSENENSTHLIEYISGVLDGYSKEKDGLVVITDKQGRILVSDDDALFTPGKLFLEVMGFSEDEEGAEDEALGADEKLSEDTMQFFSNLEENGVSLVQAPEENTMFTMNISFMAAGVYDGGYVIIIRPSGMVYRERFGVMLACTLLAIVLIAAVAMVATRLLGRVVVRRIDEANDSLEKITDGDLNERVRVYDSVEFSSLSAGINTTVDALKKSIAEAEQKNAQELATAKAIQESALPTDFPAFPNIDRFDIYASMKTAKEVGGDFYDFFEIEGTTKVGFVMADVSGKGIPAALFMMTAKTQVRTYMESGIPIDEAVNAANHQLCIGNNTGMFVTMVACVLDYKTGEFTYVNAGHNPPLVLHDGEWSWMREVSGMPLGLFDGIPYDLIARQLEEGDVLYLYTDGVTEAMDTSGALFGEERLHETLIKYTEFNPRSVSVGVRRALTDFTLDCEQSDDITMLCLKYGVPPEEKAVMNLEARTDQLVHVINYIHAELHRRHAPKSVYNPLDIAAEELFVNVCHYAYPDATPDNPGEVRISFEYNPNPPSLTVQIADDGVPYNPLAKPDAVTPDDIMEVPIGGLGILMAKNSVDEMTYERVGESNVLTFKKEW